MTSGGELFVTVGGKDIGLSALLAKVDAEMSKSANSAVRLGQQYGRLAQAQGQPALASQILAGTMQRSGAATESALIGIQTQASRLQSGSTYFQQFGAAAKSSLLGIVGPAALAGAGIAALQAGMREADAGFRLQASLDTSRKSIDLLLKGVRDSGAVWAGAAKFANTYKLTQQETTEAIQASVRIIRTSKAPIEDVLGAFARLKVLAPEKTFTDASRALSELQAGQVVSIEHLFNVPRADANEMKKAIEGGADAVQVLNGYLDKTGVTMDAVRQGAEGASGKLREMAQETEKFQLALGGGSGGAGLVILDERLALLRGSTRLLSGDMEGARQSITQAAQEGSFGFQLFNTIMGGTLGRIAQYQSAANQAAAASAQQTTAIQGASNATSGYVASLLAADQANAAALAQINALTAGMDESAQKSVLDAAQKDAQGVATQALTAETNAAVNAFLALNPNIDAAGIASGIAAGRIPPLIGQLAALAVEADHTRQALALLAAQQAAVQGVQALFAKGVTTTGGGTAGKGLGAGVGATSGGMLEANNRLRDSELQLALARAKSDGEKIALLQKQIGMTTDLVKKNQLLTQIEGLRAKGAKGGGAGGGVKLSDQQKLNNSLLASQETYDNRAEDAERAHEQRILDINRDFAKRIKEAQATFNQDTLDSNASFYDRLGSIADHGLQQSLSAQYEQAFTEAQQIATEKGADVADAFLKARQDAILAQGQRAQDIAKAQEEGDAGKAEYLRGVDELHRKAEEARLNRIKEGEDSIAAQHDKQLSDEEDKYNASVDKIGTAADRAADRKITAAERAGKAIDAENVKLERQAGLYDRVGGPRGTGGTPPATPAVPPPAAPGTTEGGPVPLDIPALLAKLDEVKSAIVSAQRETTGAVRSAGQNGGIAG